MSYQPKRRWVCMDAVTDRFCKGSETYCQYDHKGQRQGQHSVACGWKVIIDADSWRARSDFDVVPRGDGMSDAMLLYVPVDWYRSVNGLEPKANTRWVALSLHSDGSVTWNSELSSFTPEDKAPE